MEGQYRPCIFDNGVMLPFPHAEREAYEEVSGESEYSASYAIGVETFRHLILPGNFGNYLVGCFMDHTLVQHSS